MLEQHYQQRKNLAAFSKHQSVHPPDLAAYVNLLGGQRGQEFEVLGKGRCPRVWSEGNLGFMHALKSLSDGRNMDH